MTMDGLSDSIFEVAQELKLVGQEGKELWDDDYGPDDEVHFAALNCDEEIEVLEQEDKNRKYGAHEIARRAICRQNWRQAPLVDEEDTDPFSFC